MRGFQHTLNRCFVPIVCSLATPCLQHVHFYLTGTLWNVRTFPPSSVQTPARAPQHFRVLMVSKHFVVRTIFPFFLPLHLLSWVYCACCAAVRFWHPAWWEGNIIPASSSVIGLSASCAVDFDWFCHSFFPASPKKKNIPPPQELGFLTSISRFWTRLWPVNNLNMCPRLLHLICTSSFLGLSRKFFLGESRLFKDVHEFPLPDTI